MAETPNIIVVVSDTLRAADVGCYGAAVAKTPHIDAFADTAVRFTRAYPESLPTIPVRRALHTGRRAYPFADWKPVKWDIVTLPGWQPMENEEDTLAENLAIEAGYHTGFITDTLPYFAPGLNFTRGFWQWDFVRGQQQDRWKSPYSVPRSTLEDYGAGDADPYNLVPMHLANTAEVEGEEDTSTARTFQAAAEFLEDNVGGQPFYLLVDCFDPHEPWEAPAHYFRRYWGDRDYKGQRIVHCGYGPKDQFGYTDQEIEFVRAHYRGLVSLVDTWFGMLIRTLEKTGLDENTAVFLVSDHGTNFCENPRDVIGKPADAMYPGVAHLPLLARLPGRPGAGTTRDELVYNLDLTATVYDLAGAESAQGIDGESLLPLIMGKGTWERREYLTCRYNNSLCYIDDTTWALGDISGDVAEVFDVREDPDCRTPLEGGETRERWRTAWDRLLADASGVFRDYDRERTDAIGEKY